MVRHVGEGRYVSIRARNHHHYRTTKRPTAVQYIMPLYVMPHLVRFFPKLLRFRIFMKISSTFSDYNRESQEVGKINHEDSKSQQFWKKTNEFDRNAPFLRHR